MKDGQNVPLKCQNIYPLQRPQPQSTSFHTSFIFHTKPFLGAFAKLRKAAISCVVSMSVRPHGTTRVPLDGFSWNFTSEYFSNTYRENSCFIKIWQEKRVLYTKIYLLRMLNVSDNSCRGNQNTHVWSVTFISENRAVYEIIWKNIVQPDRLQMTIQHGAWALRVG